jgi:hypothetical protein
MMKAIELTGDVDAQHDLRVRVPEELPPGPVRLIVFLPGEDAAGGGWSRGVAREWASDLSDARQDVYCIDDGQCPNLLFILPMAYCAPIAAVTVPRIHSDTVCWLARAVASIRFMSAGLKRIGTIRPLASPLGSFGRPIFLGFGWGIVFELLNDCGTYRA